MRTTRLVSRLATAAFLILGAAPAAVAQAPASTGGTASSATADSRTQDADGDARRSSTPKWELDLHVGLGSAMGTPGGSGSLPSTGTLSQGQLSAATFLFGSGASLLNANLAAANASSASITPLDSVLLGSAVTRGPQSMVGVGLQRALTPRLAVAFRVDYAASHLSFEPSALNAIEVTRGSYGTGLHRALTSNTLGSDASAVSTVTDGEWSRQLIATGALVVNLTDHSRITPFVTIGGGVFVSTETMPTATVVGSSQLGTGTQIFWTDTATLRYTHAAAGVVVLGGGGLKYRLSRHLGVRADGQLQVTRNSWSNIVDASATRSLETTGTPFPSLTFGTAQFSLDGPLNAGAIANATTRSGKGLEPRFIVSTGLFLRF